jgi:hypothetical protein
LILTFKNGIQALGMLLTHFEKILCVAESEPDDCQQGAGYSIAAVLGSSSRQAQDSISQHRKILEAGRAHMAQLKAQRKLLVQVYCRDA